MLRKLLFLGALTLASALPACAAAPDGSEGEDLPTGALGEGTHWAGGWRFFDVDFSCDSPGLKNAVKPQSRRHVYPFVGKAGKVSFELSASWPKSYGALMMVTTATGALVDWSYDDGSAQLSLEATLPKDGQYWVFVSPAYYEKVKKIWLYTLDAKCSSGCDSDLECNQGQKCLKPVCITTPCDFPGQCVDQPLCAEYTTSDGRFYAKNFAPGDLDAANNWVTLDPQVQGSGVSLMTCQDANAKPCPSTDPPVCGIPISTDVAATYASVCEFRKVVREAAGTSGESKGKYTDGACPGAYCATATLSPPDTLSPTFYAKNFTDEAAAKSWLAQSFPTASKTLIYAEACDAPHACMQLYSPVCGVVKSGAQATYSNSCFFEGTVMADAGPDAESKGYYTPGACAPTCDYSDPTKTWMAKSPAGCMVVKYYCTPPSVPFSDECGCGCVTK